MMEHVIDRITLLMPLCIFFAVFLAGILIRRMLFSRISQWAQSTAIRADDVVISVMRGPFLIWCAMFGLFFALQFTELSADSLRITNKILLVLGIISVTLVLANLAAQLIQIYSRRIESAFPVTTLTQNIARIIIVGMGILVALNSLGVSIAPILATLGVGGLAVALALQDTLSNLFAGFHIIIAKQLRIGDFVKLEGGEEGYITDINWRTTKVRMLPNNVVLIPNSKLAQTVVTNYYLPDKELAVLVEVGVDYQSDLTFVEKITCEVAREIMKTAPGAVSSFEPFIRYHTFDDFSVNFTVILRAREFADQYLVKHEFIKRLHERYAKEGIVIPYPIRTLRYENGRKEQRRDKET